MVQYACLPSGCLVGALGRPALWHLARFFSSRSRAETRPCPTNPPSRTSKRSHPEPQAPRSQAGAHMGRSRGRSGMRRQRAANDEGPNGVRAEQGAPMRPDPPGDSLRREVRARLSTNQLFAATGISSIRRGTGRPCIVCEHSIASPTLEREVEGPGVFGLAHPDCYTLWREESAAVRRPPPRRWSTSGSASPRAW
jgi:hypothetical protein